jgi:hypothetical protein
VGVLDTQVPGKTGILFKEQTSDALKSALLEARDISWDYEEIRSHAIRNFSRSVFFNQIEQVMRKFVVTYITSLLHQGVSVSGRGEVTGSNLQAQDYNRKKSGDSRCLIT